MPSHDITTNFNIIMGVHLIHNKESDVSYMYGTAQIHLYVREQCILEYEY